MLKLILLAAVSIAINCQNDVKLLSARVSRVLPENNNTIAVVMTTDNNKIDLLFHASKNALFGEKRSPERAMSDALNFCGQLFVTHTYSRRTIEDQQIDVHANGQPDRILERRLLLGLDGKQLKGHEDPPTFPLTESLRGKEILLPRRIIYSDPLQTVLPFIFTRSLRISISGYWDVKINSGKNVFTMVMASPYTAPLEVIAIPKSAKLRETRFPSWPKYLYTTSGNTAMLINVAAGMKYKPRLYNATIEGVKGFIHTTSYVQHASRGQLLTLKHFLRGGCPKHPDESFMTLFLFHYGASWHSFATLIREAYATDAEIVTFTAIMRNWAKLVFTCFSDGKTNTELIVSGGNSDEFEQLPLKILSALRAQNWRNVHEPGDQLIILSAIIASSATHGDDAYLPSANGFTPHQFAAFIVDSYYQKLIRGGVTNSIDRRVLAMAISVFFGKKTNDVESARRLLTQMTILCSERQTQNPLIDLTRVLDQEFDTDEIFSMEDLFVPCAASLRFDISADSVNPSENVIFASTVYRAVYGSSLSGGSEKASAELVGDVAKTIVATAPLASAKSYANLYFPELLRCFDWTQENAIVFYIPVAESASWVMTMKPVSGGQAYRLPDVSIKRNLYLTYFNASCAKTDRNLYPTKIEDEYVNIHNSFGCRLCGHVIIRYSLRGFEDVFVINTKEEQQQMTAGHNSTIFYFRSMDTEYFNYLLLGSRGSVIRVLAFTTDSFLEHRKYIIGIVVGTLVGVTALVIAVWSVIKFCRGETKYRRLR
ncbi:Envelope glycoprotein H [Cacatuid alphaherpesvirus 2]|uniref:Envelope glycoprotein H n=1 Tax=Cacatuid alphaherpesvirus 2 TaxID=2604840 RepID=A0A5B9QZU9_9ALPH|nr:Envelope glycoprotein H [Cacatuid alphaherpesvirus 2]QEG54051.1 Envelope glycoprotein H [Cacatuid alphaherpesvirus 2]